MRVTLVFEGAPREKAVIIKNEMNEKQRNKNLFNEMTKSMALGLVSNFMLMLMVKKICILVTKNRNIRGKSFM